MILLNILNNQNEEVKRMNFLNKKHVQSFANSNNNFTPVSSKGFSQTEEQPQNLQTGTYMSGKSHYIKSSLGIRESPKSLYPTNQSNSRVNLKEHNNQYSPSYTENYALKSSPIASMTSLQNLCSEHENQILRHLCLQCNLLLCSQCISDHLQGHRETTKTIPKIETINKLRGQMNLKAEKILQFMDENNPKIVLNDISHLKFQAINKIQAMKSEVIRAFEDWCKILEKHVVEDFVKEQDLHELSNDMTKLKQEVSGLYNQMIGNQSVNAEVVRKVHQIQSEKLQAAYLQMFNNFSKTVLKSKFTFQIDWKHLMNSFQKSILLKPVHPQINQINKETHQNIQEKRSSLKNFQHLNQNKSNKRDYMDEEERRFMQGQSIESLVEPLKNLQKQQQTVGVVGSQRSHRSVGEGPKVERSFSRQGSGKRLSIFNNQEQNQEQETNQRQIQNMD